ncbi:uncharacterized protein LOC135159951 isoform X2 [Diachasmimorpha longicaudata]|uniref:uncharacterized protein LOC135159951 isoform X2 n=1 Tax=Diachasmimorpha longicaudata TaxID=58733 RepID=UPI0030B8A61E
MEYPMRQIISTCSVSFRPQSLCKIVMENPFDHPYYRITKYGLQFIGHWPFQSAKRKRFLRMSTLLIVSTIFIPKVIKFIESLNDLDIVCECVPILGCHLIAFTKFMNLTIVEDQMRNLLLSIERDWREMKLKCDIELLHIYSERARRINLFYATTIYIVVGIYFCSPAVPKVLDYFKPLNESRPRIFLYQTEYFIDQEKYYIYILIHAYVTVSICLGVIVVFDNLFATFINHACGMFEILKLHLETLHVKDYTHDPRPPKMISDHFEITINEIKRCSGLQTQNLKFVEELESSCNMGLLIIVGINMLAILFTGIVAVIKVSSPNEMIRFAFICFGLICCLFWISWLGHILIVQSETVFISAYQSEWYLMPYKLQLMIIPVMMRSLKPCRLTAGKCYVMSMESFGAALRTVLSFFMVFNSMR